MFALIKALLQGSIEHTPRYYYGVLSLHNQNRKKNYQRKQDYPHECRTTLILHSAPPPPRDILGPWTFFCPRDILGPTLKGLKPLRCLLMAFRRPSNPHQRHLTYSSSLNASPSLFIATVLPFNAFSSSFLCLVVDF